MIMITLVVCVICFAIIIFHVVGYSRTRESDINLNLFWVVSMIVVNIPIGIILFLFSKEKGEYRVMAIILWIFACAGVICVCENIKKRKNIAREKKVEQEIATKNRLTSKVKRLRLEQQKILSRWTSSPYESESEGAEQSRK